MKKIIALVLAVVLSLGALSVFAAAAPATKADVNAWLSTDVTVSGLTLGTDGSRTVEVTFVDPTVPTGAVLDLDDLLGAKIVLTKNAKMEVDGAAATLAVNDKGEITAAPTAGDKLIVKFPANTTTSEKKQKVATELTIENLTGGRSNRLSISKEYTPGETGFTNAVQTVSDDTQETAYAGIIYKADGKATVEFDFTAAALADVTVETRLMKDRKIVLNATADVPTAIDEAYPWQGLTGVKFAGDQAGVSAWKVNFLNVAEGEGFLYEVKDGKLVNVDKAAISYNKSDEVLTVSGTGAIGHYVFSSTDLKVTATPDSSAPTSSVPNPGTGSSDMIGVAVVMAVVSLGAAGAVAFKKASK